MTKKIKISMTTPDNVGVIGEEIGEDGKMKDLFPADNPHEVSEPFGRALIASGRAEEYDEKREAARKADRAERAKAAEQAAVARPAGAPAVTPTAGTAPAPAPPHRVGEPRARER